MKPLTIKLSWFCCLSVIQDTEVHLAEFCTEVSLQCNRIQAMFDNKLRPFHWPLLRHSWLNGVVMFYNLQP